MATANEVSRPGVLFGIALTIAGAGGLIGAATNAVNGAVSPTYFRRVMGWRHVEDIWRAAVAQGAFEGLAYGAVFAVVFTLVIGVASKGRATFRAAVRPLCLAGGIAVVGWLLGGLLAMGLVTLSPDFYRETFRGVPGEFGEMLKYAWVGGSIWGAMFGGLLAVLIASVTAAAEWRGENPAREPIETRSSVTA